MSVTLVQPKSIITHVETDDSQGFLWACTRKPKAASLPLSNIQLASQDSYDEAFQDSEPPSETNQHFYYTLFVLGIPLVK